MEEKILINGNFSKTNVFSIFFYVLASIYSVFWIVCMIVEPDPLAFVVLPAIIILVLIGKFFEMLLNKCQLTITNKRVYGKAAFGRRVDLPLDMISSVGQSVFKGIGVATSSGKITFYLCQNREEVFDKISMLLLERQNGNKEELVDVGNKLQGYSDLLSKGLITQEEFEAMKKKVLGL